MVKQLQSWLSLDICLNHAWLIYRWGMVIINGWIHMGIGQVPLYISVPVAVHILKMIETSPAVVFFSHKQWMISWAMLGQLAI